MFYRKINKIYDKNTITAENLSSSALGNEELQQDYDTAIRNPIGISPGDSVEGNDFKHVTESQWASHSNIIIDRLHSCAAVLFYNTAYQLIAAYHAFGGMIDANDPNAPEPDEVSLVIYAMPTLPKETDADYLSYKNIIHNLAAKYNTEKICIIDGFSPEHNGTIFANYKGQLKFM